MTAVLTALPRGMFMGYLMPCGATALSPAEHDCMYRNIVYKDKDEQWLKNSLELRVPK